MADVKMPYMEYLDNHKIVTTFAGKKKELSVNFSTPKFDHRILE